ncbi:oxidoreductase [Bacillus suaedaesalsae]|uniref:oxidoreductase n=1 Tax=Bacillus suaedaesalsae TaxID=2810349 RepID=UPI003211B39D
MGKEALVIGATGLVGKSLVHKLLNEQAYSKITILVRNDLSIRHSKLNTVKVDFDRLENRKDEFAVDDVFCCLGTTIKKAGSREAFRKVDYDYPIQAAILAKEQGANQFLVISSMGASLESPFFYSQVKGELEGKLKSISFSALHIFRPSLLLGEREEFRFGEKAAELLSKALPFLFTGKMNKYKPISADRVAEGLIKAALQNEAGTHLYESNDINTLLY